MVRPSTLAACLVLLSAPAHGATVQLRSAGTIDEEPVNRVDVVGAPGEASTLTITVRRVGADRQGSPTLVTVKDAALSLTALGGCVAVAANTVTCRGEDELGELELLLGDGDDQARVTSVTADQFIYTTIIDGGPGNDVITVGDGGEIAGGPGDDVLAGSRLYETMDGGPGNDVLFGGGHGDYLAGGPGDDVVHGGRGNDDVIGGGGADVTAPDGSDRLLGEDGDDNLDDADSDSVPAAAGPDVLDGGRGEDSLDSYIHRTAPVLVDLSGASPSGEAGEGDAVTAIEQAEGGPAADTLVGSAGPNWLDGRDGDDRVSAGAGDDKVLAYDADAVQSGEGDDVIRTDPSFAGSLRCGAGDDLVRIDAYSYPSSVPRGPYIERACERLSSGTGFGVAAHPVYDGHGRLWFDVRKYRCCRLLLTVGSPFDPFASFARTRVTSARVGVRLPPAVRRRIKAGGIVLRASVRPLGPSPFAWRFVVGHAARVGTRLARVQPHGVTQAEKAQAQTRASRATIAVLHGWQVRRQR